MKIFLSIFLEAPLAGLKLGFVVFVASPN
jgi:hypothetical protein